ncbi:MAG: galactose ABC transporter substrate-binding protein [Spirochaetes bacterium]|nr:galactose ABC transporter substrate-binding protein [Spirochaetota bacterium]MBU1079400.1 galactose ABC transporter substrate-binding protein [Spirochaetota bacterium]
MIPTTRPRRAGRLGAAAAVRASLAALAASLAACALLGCASKEARVGLFLYNQADPYIEVFARQIRDESNSAFLAVQFDAGNSQLIQNEQIEAMIAKRPALMMINPVDRLASHALIRRLKAEDIPIIFFNREPLAEDMAIWDRCYYVGARAEQSGQMQAELAMSLFGNDPSGLNEYDRSGDGVIQVIILKGEQGHQDAELRTRELLRSFEARGFSIEILAIEVANWKRDEAYEKMGALLRSHQDRLELVASNNDAMALGAIMRMRQQGFFKDDDQSGKVDRFDDSWRPVVGIDGLVEAEESIREGYLYGTVKNDSLSMAKAMVELARRAIGGPDSGELHYRLQDEKYIWIDYQPFIR